MLFDSLKTANHIFIGALEGTKELFDEVKGGLLAGGRLFRMFMENIENEVHKDLNKSSKVSNPKPKKRAKKKVA